MLHPDYGIDDTLYRDTAVKIITTKSLIARTSVVRFDSNAVGAEHRVGGTITRTITFKAPSTLGSKSDGTLVQVHEIVYTLYYARVGYGSVTNATGEENRKRIVAAAKALPNLPANAGSKTLVVNASLQFTITGLLGGKTQYMYSILAKHPDDTTVDDTYSSFTNPHMFTQHYIDHC